MASDGSILINKIDLSKIKLKLKMSEREITITININENGKDVKYDITDYGELNTAVNRINKIIHLSKNNNVTLKKADELNDEKLTYEMMMKGDY
jgi:hypothetical protein